MKSNLTLQINSLEALERLIGNDNTTEVDIRNSVVQKFAEKHLKPIAEGALKKIENDIRTATTNQVSECIGTYKNSGWSNKLQLNDEHKRLIKHEADTQIRLAIHRLAVEAVETFSDNIEDRIDKRVTRLCNEELEKLVNQRVSEKLEAIKSKIA